MWVWIVGAIAVVAILFILVGILLSIPTSNHP